MNNKILQCINCTSKFDLIPKTWKCPKCGGLLEYKYDYSSIGEFKSNGIGMWKYTNLMPKVENVITLCEGDTPTHKACRLGEKLSLGNVYLKDETRNPTGSFRDRAASLMISNALDLKFKSVVCASNGNMGASISAYCAKSGLKAHIIVPSMIDAGKLAQMTAYGAVIEEYGELVDESIIKAEKIAEEMNWYQGTPELNLISVEAQKTISFEIWEQIESPDWIITPIGSGGTIYSLWKGFKELHELDLINEEPKLIGVQAEGCSPIVKAYSKGKKEARKIRSPATRALGILVAKPLLASLALKAIKESNGLAISVSDEEIVKAERTLAKLEGIFAEPAASATVAALKKLREEGTLDSDDKIVCLITGCGLKATDILQAMAKRRKAPVIGLGLTMKERILMILEEGDAYGYQVWKKLGMVIKRAAVYQHLNELVERGLVSSYEKNGRRYYKITSRGKSVLKAMSKVRILLG